MERDIYKEVLIPKSLVIETFDWFYGLNLSVDLDNLGIVSGKSDKINDLEFVVKVSDIEITDESSNKAVFLVLLEINIGTEISSVNSMSIKIENLNEPLDTNYGNFENTYDFFALSTEAKEILKENFENTIKNIIREYFLNRVSITGITGQLEWPNNNPIVNILTGEVTAEEPITEEVDLFPLEDIVVKKETNIETNINDLILGMTFYKRKVYDVSDKTNNMELIDNSKDGLWLDNIQDLKNKLFLKYYGIDYEFFLSKKYVFFNGLKELN